MGKRVFLLIVFLSFIKVSAFSGNTSMPMGISPMRTYSSRDFKFGNGNYDMSRDYDGNVYFANINGILVYNGIEWTKLYTPNFAKVSHVYATKERNAVIAVGYDNFGKIEVDAISGELKYKSFLPLRGGKVLDSTFENTISVNWFFDTLWNSYSNKLAFISNEEYFVLQEDSIVHISKLPEEFYPHSMFSLNSNLYIYSTGGSFYKFDKESFSPVKLPFSFPEDVSINFSFSSDNGYLLFGTDKGLYIYSIQENVLKKIDHPELNHIFINVIRKVNSSLFVGTENGIYELRSKDLLCIRHITEKNGLPSNNIVWVFPANDKIWISSESGITSIYPSSPITYYSNKEGLHGDITEVMKCGDQFYVSTFDGLFVYNSCTFCFDKIEEVVGTCWDICSNGDKLLASTSSGLYEISGKHTRLITNRQLFYTYPIPEKNGYVCGGYKSLFFVSEDGQRYKEGNINIEKVTNIEICDQAVYFENVYGEIFRMNLNDWVVRPINENDGLPTSRYNKIVRNKDLICIINYKGIFLWDNESKKVKNIGKDSFLKLPSEYKNWISSDFVIAPNGNIVFINIDSHSLLVTDSTGRYLEQESRVFLPLYQYGEAISDVYFENDSIVWVTMENYLERVNIPASIRRMNDPVNHPLIKQIKVNGEIRFGGYRSQEKYNANTFVDKMHLKSWEDDIDISFTTRIFKLNDPIYYSFRLLGYDNEWTTWVDNNHAFYQKLPAGEYCFEVRVKSRFGVVSEPSSFEFSVEQIFWLKWYMLVIYGILLVLLSRFLYLWRVNSYKQKQLELENIVQQRTNKIKNQRDEIQIKSHQLQETMDNLKKSQSVIVQQEKMAMVGKLTQGLVDRILNPVNYIINFSSITSKFVKEFNEVLEDEKDGISEDGYADMKDLGSMMDGNLVKIVEHGQSVSHTLKVMENLLSEGGANMAKISINERIVTIVEYFKEQFEKDIKKYGVEVKMGISAKNILINGDVDALGKVFLSILKNSLYAVCKKRERITFEPQVSVVMKDEEKRVILHFIDNGIGMEESILQKIYDPYFTTKPSADAAGVGLYYVKDMVTKHEGTISVETKLNEGSDFVLSFPKWEKEKKPSGN